jgi:hypothetical protein
MGEDLRRVDQNEHVNNDEFLEVDDVPWRDAELLRAEREKVAFIQNVLLKDPKDLEGKSDDEKEAFVYRKWGEWWDEEDNNDYLL